MIAGLYCGSERERQTLDRRLKALANVEARENKPMARDQRRIKRAQHEAAMKPAPQEQAFRENAADIGKAQEEAERKDRKQGQRKRRPRGFTLKP